MVTGRVDPMSPAALLAFEASNPGHPPGKEERILATFGFSAARYYQALHRAAVSVEGIKADPVTARRVREHRRPARWVA